MLGRRQAEGSAARRAGATGCVGPLEKWNKRRTLADRRQACKASRSASIGSSEREMCSRNPAQIP
jgi:hypothetical protein